MTSHLFHQLPHSLRSKTLPLKGFSVGRCFVRSYRSITLSTSSPSSCLRLSIAASTMSTRSSKRQRTSKDEPYQLIYWPGVPGRGEHVRLAFEEAGANYSDVSNESKDGIKVVLSQISDKNVGDEHNPPPLAPPILKHGELCISQTSNILMYLGPQLGLVPSQESDPDRIWRVNSLTLTILDGLSNEAHDTHHPIATGDYYENQKDEAKKKAADYLDNRIPKFLGYLERVLQGEASGGGEGLS